MILVRHAAHDGVGGFLAGRSPEVRLGEAGRAQAARLAERMRRERFDTILASPQPRTRETAEAIAAAHDNVPVGADPALDEIDFGAWTGKRFEELNDDPDWRRWNAARSLARTPAGESMLDVTVRVVGLIERLAETDPEATAVLVTHADVIKAAALHALGLGIDAWPRLDVAPASISRIEVAPWGARLTLLGERVE